MHILVAIAQMDLRLAIELYLAEGPGVTLVGSASEAPSLRALVRTARPDLVVLDWALPGQFPKNLTAEIKRIDPPPQVIVLGTQTEQRPAALAAGADAFVLQADPPTRLLTAVQEARLRRASTEDPTRAETRGE